MYHLNDFSCVLFCQKDSCLQIFVFQLAHHKNAVYPTDYAQGVALACFVVVISIFVDSWDFSMG